MKWRHLTKIIKKINKILPSNLFAARLRGAALVWFQRCSKLKVEARAAKHRQVFCSAPICFKTVTNGWIEEDRGITSKHDWSRSHSSSAASASLSLSLSLLCVSLSRFPSLYLSFPVRSRHLSYLEDATCNISVSPTKTRKRHVEQVAGKV